MIGKQLYIDFKKADGGSVRINYSHISYYDYSDEKNVLVHLAGGDRIELECTSFEHFEHSVAVAFNEFMETTSREFGDIHTMFRKEIEGRQRDEDDPDFEPPDFEASDDKW